MKFLYDFFPLILFFAAFKLHGIYAATATAIAASFIQVGWYYWRHRKFETAHIVGLAAISFFGGLTLLLHDETFIKWKPSIVYWILAGVFLVSGLRGGRSITQRMFDGQIKLAETMWRNLNLQWVVFFVAVGLLNVYVAFYYGLDLSEDARREIWVNFKVFGLMGLTFVFVIIQAIIMSRHMEEADDNEKTGEQS